ncbi:uncharacterized protein LOC123534484 isoform X1 [Mercenaria mercenaria]|uniref:uncharacterized protein LOC123534484 isoform X1 n=1 Tax=Mercenaria mercenaria TaxID=6596 RepID=UPI00234ED9CC|nr:uncharacterized protein LOC123534484 isoform X1 [Mercenaria mercenaria]
MTIKLKAQYIGIIIATGVIIFLIRNIGYLVAEFALHCNINVKICNTCSMKYQNELRQTKRIPNIMHQIYFPVKSKTLSKDLIKARTSCIQTHSGYTHYLWNETEVIKFIRTEYPHIEPLYSSYDYWVRRVNVARYLILYHYGGWYVDLDMTCVKSVSNIAEEVLRLNKSVVQHYTWPVGTSNDFFGVTPKHQFLKSVLDHLPNSNRWFIFPYPNTVLTTGTTYMWGRYLNYPYGEEFFILNPDEIKTYFRHHHDSAWHGWDAQIIRFFVHNYHKILPLSVLIIIILMYFWVLRK